MNLPSITTRVIISGGEREGVIGEDTTVIPAEVEDMLDLTLVESGKLNDGDINIVIKNINDLFVVKKKGGPCEVAIHLFSKPICVQ